MSVLDLPPLRGNPFDLRPIEPSRVEYLVGRDKLLSEWREHLISQTPRMLLLVGDRGSGRTSFLNALASTTSRRPYIGQFWPEADDPVQGIIHELSVHFGGFDIPPSMQQVSDKMVEILDKETGTLPLIAFDYPASVDLNQVLSRLSPLLQRLRALVVVVLTPAQLAGLDDEVLDIYDSPHHLLNLDEKQIQILSDRRVSRSANQKWNIRPSLLSAIHNHTDGNPRRVIRLLRDLIDERHNPSDGGTLDLLTTWRAPTIETETEMREDQLLSLANTRARLRMTTLYYFAAFHRFLVAGTGNKVEDFGVGFYTKYGDGGVDLSPIADLLKSQVYELAKYLEVIDEIQNAIPTDGLWSDNRTDEEQIGASYNELEWAMEELEQNPSLEGLDESQRDIIKIYKSFNHHNLHKMNPIPVCEIPPSLLI